MDIEFRMINDLIEDAHSLINSASTISSRESMIIFMNASSQAFYEVLLAEKKSIPHNYEIIKPNVRIVYQPLSISASP